MRFEEKGIANSIEFYSTYFQIKGRIRSPNDQVSSLIETT